MLVKGTLDPFSVACDSNEQRGKCELDGFTPGQTAWGRVRKIGRHGETGPWSDPAKIMAV